MFKPLTAISAAALIAISPITTPVTADTSLDQINVIMASKGSMHNNRVGALIGARAHCGLEYKPLVQTWSNRYAMNSKTPRVKFEQMLNVAKSTLSDLSTQSVTCSDAAKQSLMSRVE